MLLSPSSQACTCIKESRLQTNLFAFSIRFTKAGGWGGVGWGELEKQNKTKKAQTIFFWWLVGGGGGGGEGGRGSFAATLTKSF